MPLHETPAVITDAQLWQVLWRAFILPIFTDLNFSVQEVSSYHTQKEENQNLAAVKEKPKSNTFAPKHLV